MPDEVLSNVLLESGTNELEVMEFKIGNRFFGINVAKVLEILRYTEITPMPNTSPYIEGIFKPRNTIITVVDLPKYLDLDSNEDPSKDILIITRFNGSSTAFHVNAVEGINRISWSDIEKPDPAIYGNTEGIATGIARYDNRLITILDFEKIMADLNPSTKIEIDNSETTGRETNRAPIVVVEDSPILMRMITENLVKMGYVNITKCFNGQEALDLFESHKELGGIYSDHCAVLITDIEMPKVDGHRLIKILKQDPFFYNLPCIIFSSLITDEMRLKGTEVGASEQVSKPEISNLVNIVDKYTHI